LIFGRLVSRGSYRRLFAGRRGAGIEGIELVGNEIFVNLSSGQHALTMRVAPQSLPHAGEDIRVAIQPQGLHFFNPESGERL